MGSIGGGGGVSDDFALFAYSRKEWARAVNLSALFGWAAVSCPFVFETGLGLLPYAAVFGLPVAFLACWLIAAPILKRLMRRPISWRQAAIWGAAIAITIRISGIVIGVLHGLFGSLTGRFSSQIGGGDFVRSIDGIPTLCGWIVILRSLAFVALFGALIALILRAVIGPGKNPDLPEE